MGDLKEHKVELINRNFLKITGVESVGAVTDKQTEVNVLNSCLVITGSQLKAESLSIENGEIVLSGLISGLRYTSKKEKQSLFKRIFK